MVKKKKGKNTADEEVPQTKLDLTIRDKKAGDKKKGGPGDAGSKGSKSKAAAEKPEEPKKPSKAAKARGKPVDEPADDGDYLGDMDLPPSSSSEDEEEENARRQPLYTAEDKRQEELKVKVRASCWGTAAQQVYLARCTSQTTRSSCRPFIKDSTACLRFKHGCIPHWGGAWLLPSQQR